MSNWKESFYEKAEKKNFEIAVNNIPGLIQEFSFKFEELVKPMRLKYININVNNTFDINKKDELNSGSSVTEFTIQNTTLKAKVSFEHKLIYFDLDGKSLLTVRIESEATGALLPKEGSRKLLDLDFEHLLKNAFESSLE